MYPIFWLLGISGSGKTTLANGVLKVFNMIYLDNDAFRKEIGNYSFTEKDKVLTTNLLREKAIYYSKFLPVIVTKITPLQEMRDLNRKLIPTYYEIWCRCPLELVIKRDVKGLYKKLNNMVGTSSKNVFEYPKSCDLILNTDKPYDICLGNLINFMAKQFNKREY